MSIVESRKGIGIFSSLDYCKVNRLSNTRIKELIKKCCTIIWSLYKIEWWKAITSKVSKSCCTRVKCSDFPTTNIEVKNFFESEDTYHETFKNIKPHKKRDGSSDGMIYLSCSHFLYYNRFLNELSLILSSLYTFS